MSRVALLKATLDVATDAGEVVRAVSLWDADLTEIDQESSLVPPGSRTEAAALALREPRL